MPSKNDDFFGGMFDFNGDGKTTIDEEFLAFKIFEESTKNEDEEKDEFEDELEDEFSDDDYVAPIKLSTVTTPPFVPQKAKMPETLSRENYSQRKSSLKSNIIFNIIAGLAMSLIPIAVMWATIKAYDEKNSAYWLVFLLFFGGGLVILGIIWSIAGKAIGKSFSDLNVMKDNYKKLLTNDELSAIQKKKRKGKIITTCVFATIIISLITISAVNTAKLSNAYNKAVLLVDNGSFEEAKTAFEEIEEKNYHDTAAYISLCKAHIDFEKGRISSAYYDMNNVQFYYQTSEQIKSVSDFVSTLKTKYDEYLKEKSESNAKAYRDRITYGVPYVGMSESEIGNTSLGAPSSNVRHNSEMINGERCFANLYDFKQGNKTIFTARCIKGRVTEVWDNRSKSNTSSYTSRKSTKSKKTDDPYDVNDYSNEEDFYYDHYDDFFDYYDAEDYYNEHHD